MVWAPVRFISRLCPLKTCRPRGRSQENGEEKHRIRNCYFWESPSTLRLRSLQKSWGSAWRNDVFGVSGGKRRYYIRKPFFHTAWRNPPASNVLQLVVMTGRYGPSVQRWASVASPREQTLIFHGICSILGKKIYMVIPGKCFSSPAGVGGSHLTNIPALVFLSLCRLPLPLM